MLCQIYFVCTIHVGDVLKKGVKTVQWKYLLIKYTLKLAHDKLSANAGNFTCRPHVKRPDTQFTCVTCSLPVKRGKFTCVYAVSTLRRIPEELPAPHVKLPDYNSSATGMQDCLLLKAKIHAITGKNMHICIWKYLQLQAILPSHRG